ncbi:MAG: hypothetical protein KAS72_06475 [Phycisphaerales bacterium]|nr:hypothetical protein [Phycisphaerales bacterium]
MTDIKDVLVMHHTHTDVGYTHAQPIFWELSRRFIDEALDYCDETADWPEGSRMCWTCEVTAPIIDWLRNASDQQVERFSAAAQRGQIAVGAMFANITPLYTLEQLAQSLLPVRELREQFGLPISVAINHDVNGLPWSIIPLLRDAGINGLLMGINIHFGGFPLHRPLGFNWQGPDGRTITAFNGEHYQSFDAHLKLTEPDVTTEKMAAGLDQYVARLAKAGYGYDFIYLTATHPGFCDNNPPNPNLPGLIRRWNDEGREPRIQLVTPEAVIERLEQQPAAHVPTYRGDWTDFWNFGSGSAAMEAAINRRAKARLSAALSLATAQSLDEGARAHLREARWNLNLHDEHTWGSFCGILSKCPTLYLDQWTFKAACAHRAAAYTALLMRDQLEGLAGNPRQGTGVESFLLYNPSPVAKRIVLPLYKPLTEGTWHHLSSTVHRFDTDLTLRREECEIYAIDANALGPVDVPALSWITVDREDLKPAGPPPGVAVSGDSLTSSHHELTFDPKTGRILTLRDRTLGVTINDATSPWDFCGFVRETVAELNERAKKLGDPREAFFASDWEAIHEDRTCWVPDWKADRSAPTELISLHAERRPDGARLIRRYRADGVDDLMQIITLCEYEPTVRFEIQFKKEDVREPEGIYFAFPLAVPEWRAHFDTAGCATEYDAEQLPGCCRDWITADTYLATHNDDVCITLACPDAPLFQLGGFNFARHQQAVPDRRCALILAWPMNNYWHTNFRPSQPGYCRLRYELRCARTFDPCEASVFGRHASTMVEIHPVVKKAGASVHNLVSLQGEGVSLVDLKQAEYSDGVIARLLNHRETEVVAELELPGRRMHAAQMCDSLETPRAPLRIADNKAHIPLGPRAVVTVHLETAGLLQRARDIE